MKQVYTFFMRKILFWAIMIFILALYIGLSFFGASIINLNPSQDQISDLQARVDILKSLTEAVAIVIAGVWTYEVYIKNRYDHPYPQVQHHVSYYDLDNNFAYLSVFVTVKNEGKTKLDLSGGIIYVRKVLPLSKRIHDLIAHSDLNLIRQGKNMDERDKLFIDQGQRIGWDTIGDRLFDRTLDKDMREKMHELEPGQSREIQFDFLFKDRVDVVEIISYFRFKKSGWEYATLHSLNRPDVSVQG